MALFRSVKFAPWASEVDFVSEVVRCPRTVKFLALREVRAFCEAKDL